VLPIAQTLNVLTAVVAAFDVMSHTVKVCTPTDHPFWPSANTLPL
jgi:hypothetical protein